MEHDRPKDPYISTMAYSCPNIADDADIRSHFEGVETALGGLGDTDMPHLQIICKTCETANDVLGLLLKGSIFPRYFGELRKVSLRLDDKRTNVYPGAIYPDEILSAPTHFTQDGVTIQLSTAQRAEWLLHNLRKGDRDRYLRGLLEASRAAPAVPPNADSQLDSPALAEVLARIEQPVESRRQGDDGGVGIGQIKAGL